LFVVGAINTLKNHDFSWGFNTPFQSQLDVDPSNQEDPTDLLGKFHHDRTLFTGSPGNHG
jgi:hypothetical protein